MKHIGKNSIQVTILGSQNHQTLRDWILCPCMSLPSAVQEMGSQSFSSAAHVMGQPNAVDSQQDQPSYVPWAQTPVQPLTIHQRVEFSETTILLLLKWLGQFRLLRVSTSVLLCHVICYDCYDVHRCQGTLHSVVTTRTFFITGGTFNGRAQHRASQTWRIGAIKVEDAGRIDRNMIYYIYIYVFLFMLAYTSILDTWV